MKQLPQGRNTVQCLADLAASLICRYGPVSLAAKKKKNNRFKLQGIAAPLLFVSPEQKQNAIYLPAAERLSSPGQ